MQFSLVEVIKTKENWFYVEWDMSPDLGESIDDWNFEIWWSLDPASGYIPITDSVGDPIIIDGAIGPLTYTHEYNQYDFNKDRYYKVKAIFKTDPLIEILSTRVFIGMYSDGIHETIKHAEDTLHTMYHGEPCLVIKRKTFGARCPTCWSHERNQSLRSHCDTCHGTGFVTGYYQPIQVQISFDSDPRKSDVQKEWENVYDSKRARVTNYPLLKPRDLIVNEDDYKRYVITHVETTKLPKLSESSMVLSKQNYILSQMLTLEELNPDDNEYFIDVDNIPQIPISEDPGSGSDTPYFNDHRPVTVEDPLEITDGYQNLALKINTDDFQIVNGELSLRYSAGSIGIQTFVTDEILATLYKVLAIQDNGRVVIADFENIDHLNRVVGISLNIASVGMDVFAQKLGIITDPSWNWEVGKSIFFDVNGDLTQTPQTPNIGFFMIVAKVITPTSIDVLLRSPVIRAVGAP